MDGCIDDEDRQVHPAPRKRRVDRPAMHAHVEAASRRAPIRSGVSRPPWPSPGMDQPGPRELYTDSS
jgi:hypothetical protein